MSFFTLPNLKDVSGQNQLNITTNDVETQPEDSTDKTAKAKQNLKLFNQFCSTVTPFLTGNEEMVGFLQKRFHAASDMFKASEDLQNLLNTTLMKILKDKNNVFVHIRDLNNEFKAYRGSKVHKKRRCGHGDGSGTDSSCIEASDEKKRRINGKQNGDFGLSETSDSTYISDISVSTHLKQNHSKQKDNSSRTNSPILELTPTREITNKTLHRLTIFEAEETTSDPDSKRTPKTILNGSRSDSETPQSTGASRIFNKNTSIKLHNIGAAGRKDPEEWTDPGEGCSGLADTNKPDDHEDLLNDAKVALEDDPEQSQSEGEGRRKEKKKGSAKQLKKLEDLLEKISKKIQALSEQELDFSDLDHEDSTYLQEEKLKRHFMKIWKRICQLKERSDATGRLTETKFKFEGTRYPDINKRIERFINKTRQFPDYHDIRKEIMKTNQKKGLKLGKRSIDELSKEAFIEVGNSLQSRRKDDFVKDFGCHMTDTYREFDDPALYDRDLKRKLEQNKHIGHNRLEAVISKFTYKQEVDGDSTADTDESESELPANQSGAESTNEEANGKKGL
ncbi:unnamed protein product [Owenia fusiformis]|uniref:Death domain-associated protein 6 n=1 Tax=Owenia fusiformis TaxID=6347 RepID=A0A8J1TYM6_OWEFU|nr:unnamed protein product [Owenia fusiformis]